MKRVLLAATTTGYQIRSFGEAAERVGVRLVFASDRCDRLDDPWWDQAIPVRFHDEARSVDAVAAALGAAPPDGIVAVGDRPVVLAAHLSRAFGLPGHPPAAAAVTRNKLLTRRALASAGLPSPWFEAARVGPPARRLAAAAPYPAVIKPLALSGSRGVMRVNDAGECASAIDRLERLLQLPDVRLERDEAHLQVLIESFIPGSEYAIEAVLDRGVFRLLAIFDKPDPLNGPFFEETMYVTPSGAAADLQHRMAAAAADAARAIGLHHGPIHAECRVNDRSVYVLEVAARPIGGLCSRALRFSSPRSGPAALLSLEEVLLRHAVGEDITEVVREQTASGVMMIPIPARGIFRSVDGLEEARRVTGIEDVRITAKPDAPIVPLPEGRSYLGFIFARGGRPGDVQRTLRESHGQLRFAIDREVPVLGPA
ncbi:MAG: hypothetical protein A3F70_02660 [Acidobacteria bacterium RIFCSPLOWO2_12_FULL_67_14]|nr:MAG: hypothetical protein A3H29_19420 [Acidobacteria bacterium RIFCSPLOWO2_02_FULL_67_21]OFW37077.1 MAG: hypothetical protein A3F70_02660 [Acidobacteria bacterium RIFCSPLOWO2_12_FULL_67_14]